MKILRNLMVATVLVLAVIIVRLEGHEQSCYEAGLACIEHPNTNMVFPYDPDYWCTHGIKHWWYECKDVIENEVLWQGWCEATLTCE